MGPKNHNIPWLVCLQLFAERGGAQRHGLLRQRHATPRQRLLRLGSACRQLPAIAEAVGSQQSSGSVIDAVFVPDSLLLPAAQLCLQRGSNALSLSR